MKHVNRAVFGKKGSAAICIIPILSIHVSQKPSELSNVTPLPKSKFSIKSLKRDSVGGYTGMRRLMDDR